MKELKIHENHRSWQQEWFPVACMYSMGFYGQLYEVHERLRNSMESLYFHWYPRCPWLCRSPRVSWVHCFPWILLTSMGSMCPFVFLDTMIFIDFMYSHALHQVPWVPCMFYGEVNGNQRDIRERKNHRSREQKWKPNRLFASRSASFVEYCMCWVP